MPQNTNLNVSPYFDDFNENKNYHKVLFKPGFPVQARELTTLQSILQNQVEKFGRHFFKEGSMVIPGGTFYDPNYFAVKIDPNFLFVNEGYNLRLTEPQARMGMTQIKKLDGFIKKRRKNADYLMSLM